MKGCILSNLLKYYWIERHSSFSVASQSEWSLNAINGSLISHCLLSSGQTDRSPTRDEFQSHFLEYS